MLSPGFAFTRRLPLKELSSPGAPSLSKTRNQSISRSFSRTMRLPLLLAYILGLGGRLYAQDDCEKGHCHPTVGDLLVGRNGQLTASSTCGLNEPEKYCILGYLEAEQKCFICDSRNPYNPYTESNSHLVENVITTFQPDRKKKWWQSQNGIDHVSIRLDLETLFQFSHLILTFKTFRPSAMLVERSRDYGQTWKVFRYFAQDCVSAFPNVPTGEASRVDDVVCDSRYSDIEPSTEGEVVLKALDPTFEIENPYSPFIQDLITLTNLRINFTKLHTLGDTLRRRRQSSPLDKYYYALYEIVAQGNCFCNGHASHCVPVQNVRGDVFIQPAMVHGKCVCQHYTDGLNCERCKDLYNDVPWKPAEGLQDSACKKCNCNSHSEKCHFDMDVYQANYGLSGGVCDDCQHNTFGHHCELCKPFFYHDPLRDISDPYACIPCDCDPEGTLYNGRCDSQTDLALGTVAGKCLCKENVDGPRCDRCKAGYFGLSANDPLGCQYCSCNPWGSLPDSTCDPVTGECLCQRLATGRYCDECLPGYWGLGNSLHACTSCDCDIGGAYNNLCSSNDGQCECLPHIVGRQCKRPAPGYYIVPLDYYIYEAELAQPLYASESIVKTTAAPTAAPTALPTAAPTAAPELPKCDDYFRQQGIAYKYINGRIILKSTPKDNGRERRQAQHFLPTDTPVQTVFREPTPGSPVTWTGPGYARILSGAGLRFTIDNIPFPMDFVIALHYEPETSGDWKAKVVVNSTEPSSSARCRNTATLNAAQIVTLPAASRIALLDTQVCLEPGINYLIDVYFSQLPATDSQSKPHILIDSLGLIAKAGAEDVCSRQELGGYQQYNCIEVASEFPLPPEACEDLIVSISARMHNGALQCRCDGEGSLGASCGKFGEQCVCKSNVVGPCCDRCAAGFFGSGPDGCTVCDCHDQGSTSSTCDSVTGQCSCGPETQGRRCDQCLSGYFGFPICRVCACNGNAELCDPRTGACLNCKGFTTGENCERCVDGYYGNPLLEERCRPCLCPDSPASGQYFARSCYQDPESSEVICNCLQGYSGNRCDDCPAGFYSDVEQGGRCVPCSCSNNIDSTDPASCDKFTGECLKCLHNTHGPSCQFCRPGFFGSALEQNCTRCACNSLGINPIECPPDEECACDQETGQCPCLPNVIGTDCDQCTPGTWNMVSGEGCQFCDCDPNTSASNECDQFTGECPCKPEFGGKSCDDCGENYYGSPRVKCIPCRCNLNGTRRPVCDKQTGACNCQVGVIGRRCDRCARGYRQEFPSCPLCHLCFDQWDDEMTSLLQAVQGLIRFTANLDEKKRPFPSCDIYFKSLEEKLSAIEGLLKSPVLSSEEFLKVRQYHDNIRQEVDDIYDSLKELQELSGLNATIDELMRETDRLFKEVEKIRQRHTNAEDAQVKVCVDAFNKISMHYDASLNAEIKTYETLPILWSSSKTRGNIKETLRDLAQKEKENTRKLNKMNFLDVAKLNTKICGTKGNTSCDQSPCGGALCKDYFGNKKCGGPNCGGALALSTKALEKADNADLLLNNFTRHLQESEMQIKTIRQMAAESKTKAQKLNETLLKAMKKMEMEKEKTKDLIQQVKLFLMDEFVPPEDIEKVANHVLAISLPATPQDLLKVISKIKTFCDDYQKNKTWLNQQLEEVEKLSDAAKHAEEAAAALPNVDEIRKNLKEAEDIQTKTRKMLKAVNNEIKEVTATISQAQGKADRIDDNLDDFSKRHEKLQEEISALQEKMLANRNQAKKVKKEAESALDEANMADDELVTVKERYDFLINNLTKRDIPEEIRERVKRIKNEAEKVSKEVDKKLQRIEDLEKTIDDLNYTKQEMEDNLLQLEKQATAHRNAITKREREYATCGA
ncbi:laminin subunit beta-4 isoform X2 [Ambystoma mexicanum]|uniref:laminin subunit beta-4 isoform X2 n=1 Tax=Ambystoma mexicanum TaxID=8296 RepID=UPI0037E9504C